ncbi:AlpA family transcriptional regulator [Shewanella sp. LC6]|uniref:helix-turn-helix transcriptional regulator n=1 Tax=unclassified Shewanella TaxID=196818 RepID=UPI00112C015B|nr:MULTISPECIES: AlpA family transcriptional regulator [unclassified Shewanella]QQK59663.1 AlpA family transcriptional regulator [Shewanella sp. LC6]TPE56630.1 AlpA family transcriptional regulator [Shewanella sp. LC2]
MNHQQATNEPLFLTTKEVLERYRIKSKVTLWKWRKEAGFPEPIHNGRHYAKDSLDKWGEQQKQAA